jgi:hypothetical protein
VKHQLFLLAFCAPLLGAACGSTGEEQPYVPPPRPAPELTSADFSDADHVASEQEAAEWAASNITEDNADQVLDELEQEILGDS